MFEKVHMESTPDGGVTIVVTSRTAVVPESQGKKTRRWDKSGRSLRDVCYTIKQLLPFVIIISSVFSMYCGLTFGFIFLYHVLILCLHERKGEFPAIVKQLWVDLHFQYLLLSIALFFSRLRPVLFFIDYLLLCISACVKVIDYEIASRLTEHLAKRIQSYTRPILKGVFLERMRAYVEIMCCPYLLFESGTTLDPKVCLLACMDAMLFLPLAFHALEEHRRAWHFIGSKLRVFPGIESLILQIAKIEKVYDE